MSNQKQQREIDKAFEHLHAFLDKDTQWRERFDLFVNRHIDRVALQRAQTRDAVLSALFEGPYRDMASKYLYEQWVTGCRGHEKLSYLDRYLRQSGWREGAEGRRFLQEMSLTDLRIWEVTDAVPGESISLRLYGSNDASVTVLERAASRDIARWTCLVSRVVSMGEDRLLTGGMLSFAPTDAEHLQQLRDSCPEADGDTEAEQFSTAAFQLWLMRSLPGLVTPPVLRNSDDESIAFCRYRFPLQSSLKNAQARLRDRPEFHQQGDNRWSWESVEQHGHASIVLGTLTLDNGQLVLETHSSERARRGIELLKNLYGDSLGQEIGVVENTESLIAAASEDNTAVDQDTLDATDLLSVIKSHLDRYYRGTLDKPTPMLDNRTPRQCAADTTAHPQVLAWLKTMELNGEQSGQAYDISWMWQELGLASYRQV